MAAKKILKFNDFMRYMQLEYPEEYVVKVVMNPSLKRT